MKRLLVLARLASRCLLLQALLIECQLKTAIYSGAACALFTWVRGIFYGLKRLKKPKVKRTGWVCPNRPKF